MSGDPEPCEWCGSIWHQHGICGQRGAAYRAFESEYMKKEIKFVKLPDPFETPLEFMDKHTSPAPPVDVVNNPPHYTSSGIQPIEAIEAWGLGFNLGNCVKYCSRAGKKDPTKHIEDLEKAAFYLNREIANLKKAKSGGA